MTLVELALPGDVEGLLTEGSIVGSSLVPGCRGIVLRVVDDHADVCWLGPASAPGHGDEVEHDVSLADICLLLEYAGNRSRTVRRLAGQFGVSISEGFVRDSLDQEHACYWLGNINFCAKLDLQSPSNCHVPTLDDLDYRSDRLLDDGSLWVDAEALRLVWLFVL